MKKLRIWQMPTAVKGAEKEKLMEKTSKIWSEKYKEN